MNDYYNSFTSVIKFQQLKNRKDIENDRLRDLMLRMYEYQYATLYNLEISHWNRRIDILEEGGRAINEMYKLHYDTRWFLYYHNLQQNKMMLEYNQHLGVIYDVFLTQQKRIQHKSNKYLSSASVHEVNSIHPIKSITYIK